MEALDSHTHQELAKVQLGARHEPEDLPASLSFKDLQSICGKTSMEIKAIPVKGFPRANILGCYGILSLCRHKSSDEVRLSFYLPLTQHRFSRFSCYDLSCSTTRKRIVDNLVESTLQGFVALPTVILISC